MPCIILGNTCVGYPEYRVPDPDEDGPRVEELLHEGEEGGDEEGVHAAGKKDGHLFSP